MRKLKIFPKMFIQIFSVLGIIIILVHSLVFFYLSLICQIKLDNMSLSMQLKNTSNGVR